ncbi:chaperone protein dnaJ C76, chloroplastic [Capsicum chacoense]|uniref:chaperone protein dnaJ C76, chloroplastic n=1 Tax=Capsicum annuum TaxID=4072 RepID=UPI0007BFDEFA|nr:chaperone protein dnaJ C76, chloroplastic [Capsicum annuum]
MHSSTLPIQTIPTKSINKLPNPRAPLANSWKSHNKNTYNNSLICSAHTSSITDFDLYDLLGVESSSNQAQIKLAYRMLQKRCHPDIAGPSGHDMAIILNEVYALLSDPIARMAYDKELTKIADLRGYTGKPLYSAWCGEENEKRAVFVDEVKCVGCLKCALLAEKTFAVECMYGRARVVAQWADTEAKIQEAIDACPVDCISVVERSNLAALEFLMSKKLRGNVRIGAGNTVGARTSNIFDDLDKFQSRYQDSVNKASKTNPKASDMQKEARMSAFQAIRAMSNWFYWQSPIGGAAEAVQALVPVRRSLIEPDVTKLRDAEAAMKQVKKETVNQRSNDEYWSPSTLALPEATDTSLVDEVSSNDSSPKAPAEFYDEVFSPKEKQQPNPWLQGVPFTTATAAAIIVWIKLGEEATVSLNDHIGGSLALDIVNSSWLKVILAGVTWHSIGMTLVELSRSLHSLFGKGRKL